MTAHFFVPSLQQDRVRITGEDARHAARVLRLRAGEEVSLADGSGVIARGSVVGEPAPDAVDVVIDGHEEVPPNEPAIRVCPALPKGGKLDLVVQKLTEIGVDRITPWAAERSVVRWDDRKREANVARLRAIAREAAKQSRRATIPEIDVATDGMPTGDWMVVFHEAATDRLAVPTGAAPATATIVIGPEGGLTVAEIDAATAAEAQVVTLGRGILRAETAAIVGPALVMAAFHLLG